MFPAGLCCAQARGCEFYAKGLSVTADGKDAVGNFIVAELEGLAIEVRTFFAVGRYAETEDLFKIVGHNAGAFGIVKIGFVILINVVLFAQQIAACAAVNYECELVNERFFAAFAYAGADKNFFGFAVF